MAGTAQYGKGRDYWDKRYLEDPEPFDWYQRYESLKHIINKWCPRERMLVVGCGNSKLSEDMFHDGYEQTINIDISPVVIEQMKSKNTTAMEYLVLDVTDMPSLESGSFASVLDKGTLDALLCGEGSAENADRMCSEISRLLKPGGVFMLITYGSPKTRLPYLEPRKYQWEVSKLTVDKPTVNFEDKEQREKDVHYVYCCKKRS